MKGNGFGGKRFTNPRGSTLLQKTHRDRTRGQKITVPLAINLPSSHSETLSSAQESQGMASVQPSQSSQNAWKRNTEPGQPTSTTGTGGAQEDSPAAGQQQVPPAKSAWVVPLHGKSKPEVQGKKPEKKVQQVEQRRNWADMEDSDEEEEVEAAVKVEVGGPQKPTATHSTTRREDEDAEEDPEAEEPCTMKPPAIVEGKVPSILQRGQPKQQQQQESVQQETVAEVLQPAASVQPHREEKQPAQRKWDARNTYSSQVGRHAESRIVQKQVPRGSSPRQSPQVKHKENIRSLSPQAEHQENTQPAHVKHQENVQSAHAKHKDNIQPASQVKHKENMQPLSQPPVKHKETVQPLPSHDKHLETVHVERAVQEERKQSSTLALDSEIERIKHQPEHMEALAEKIRQRRMEEEEKFKQEQQEKAQEKLRQLEERIARKKEEERIKQEKEEERIRQEREEERIRHEEEKKVQQEMEKKKAQQEMEEKKIQQEMEEKRIQQEREESGARETVTQRKTNKVGQQQPVPHRPRSYRQNEQSSHHAYHDQQRQPTRFSNRRGSGRGTRTVYTLVKDDSQVKQENAQDRFDREEEELLEAHLRRTMDGKDKKTFIPDQEYTKMENILDKIGKERISEAVKNQDILLQGANDSAMVVVSEQNEQISTDRDDSGEWLDVKKKKQKPKEKKQDNVKKQKERTNTRQRRDGSSPPYSATVQRISNQTMSQAERTPESIAAIETTQQPPLSNMQLVVEQEQTLETTAIELELDHAKLSPLVELPTVHTMPVADISFGSLDSSDISGSFPIQEEKMTIVSKVPGTQGNVELQHELQEKAMRTTVVPQTLPSPPIHIPSQYVPICEHSNTQAAQLPPSSFSPAFHQKPFKTQSQFRAHAEQQQISPMEQVKRSSAHTHQQYKNQQFTFPTSQKRIPRNFNSESPHPKDNTSPRRGRETNTVVATKEKLQVPAASSKLVEEPTKVGEEDKGHLQEEVSVQQQQHQHSHRGASSSHHRGGRGAQPMTRNSGPQHYKQQNDGNRPSSHYDNQRGKKVKRSYVEIS